MARDFDLTSQKWMDLIFKDKNKSYGAYEMRESSSDRHLKALIIVTIVGLALIYLPTLIQKAIPTKTVVDETTVIEMTNMEIKQEIPEENKIRQLEDVPPPPVLKKTVQFTPPKIVKDEEMREEDAMITQDELTDTKAAISVATVDGVEGGGVDIQDLEKHQVVVKDDTPQEIYSHVEEPPMFPGGEAELMKWLGNNISYPVIAQEQGIEGRVILRFVVEPDGTIGNVEVQRSLDPSCDREALNKVKKMPKWKPGRQNGNPVRVYYTLPVLFRLDKR